MRLRSKATAAAGAAKARALVIVESPAKARTIQGFLDKEKYTVDFCLGHIRDLARQRMVPKELKKVAPMGIDVNNSFTPIYVPVEAKAEIVARLAAELEDCDELILATDEDREGEAISWHLLEVQER